MNACAIEAAPYANGALPAPGGHALTARAITLAELAPGARVLDLGCGSGGTVTYLRETLHLDAVGVDAYHQAPVPNAPLLRAQAQQLPFAAGAFDAVVAQCSLSVMSDQKAVIDECARVLAPGGKLVLTDIYARAPEEITSAHAHPGSPIEGVIGREQMSARLAACGFQVTIWEDHSHVLKEFIFHYIMEHGSPPDPWGCQAGGDGARNTAALKRIRPGYFLLIAAVKEKNYADE